MDLKPRFIVFLVCLSLLLSACGSGLMKDLADLGKLRQQLLDKYHEQDIGVNLQNGEYLTISFINSQLNQESESQRLGRAAETAQFVVRNFKSIQKIQGIWVAFIEAQTHFLIFHYSRTLGVFPFNNRGEPVNNRGESSIVPDPANIVPSSDDPLSPNIRFNAARNETNISLTRIQLAGDPSQDGLALVPSYTAKGNVQEPARDAAAPDYVTLDFASYADRKLFSSDMRLGIACDRQPQFLTTAHLLVPTGAGAKEGSNAQFLTAQLPFTQFAKIGKARNVKIRLGQKEYQLKSDEITALKNLADLVSPPAAGR